MHLTVQEVHVADGDHDGFIKGHLDKYLSPSAQDPIDELAAKNQDIATASLFAEHQMILIEATPGSATTEEDLKRILHGFGSALGDWIADLSTEERFKYSQHSNPRLDAHKAYSGSHADHFED